PRLLAPENPVTAPLAGTRRSTIGPNTLFAAMSQSVVLPEHVFFTMMLPATSTSMPRSAPMQLLPSMRLSALVAWMPAPSPAPFPLRLQSLLRTRHELKTLMPSPTLLRTVHRLMVHPEPVVMP